MKESEAYKTYHDLPTRKVQPKLKYVRRSSRTKTDEAPKPSSGKRVKATAKETKSGKKKQPAPGLEALSDIALTEAEQMKLAIERSKTQLHSSQPSGSGAHEGTGVSPGVPDAPTYQSDDEEISWKSSAEDDDDEVNVSEHEDDNDDERTESDNDGDDFVHPKFSTHNEEEGEEESFDPRVQTPSHVESTDDEDDDEEVQGVNIEGEEMDEEANNEEDEGNELYRDLNVNLEGRDVEMTDDQPTNVQTTQSSSVHLASLKTLETDFSEFKQTNQFAKSVSSIPGIVDAYLANKMNEAVKTDVQLQSNRLRDETQAENEDFLDKLDDNIKKIIKNQVKEQVKAQVSKILPKIEKTVNEQLKAEIMTRSSTESKTSLALAANLSELELKNILIEKMEGNKRRDDEDKDEEPSFGSNRGSKRRRARKEPESTSAPKEKTSRTTGKSTDGSKSQHKSAGESAHTEEPMQTYKDLEEPAHQEFDIGATEEQSDEETSQHPDWFQKPAKIPTPDRDWNKTLPVVHGPVQPWLSNLAREEGPRESFDELMDTPLDFSAL
ncbi:hypothetical protein Tco_0841320 [Tanacetum coccineum]|uniref:Uncharacterized protein n=1 Tax=Tanacetum coccineum TaxID=301880 RepID=A0ABQ5AZY1_9ASTR